MKTAFSHQHSVFRQSVLVFALCSLFLVPAQAQEAFYIYRNDGDFNGFFYDEVVEMRQSKIGVDSIEYDRWVTQEVVLADTIYRIPLAAIDSIGFQQPEIKLNPKVKFIERDGLAPYLLPLYSYTTMEFQNLPASLTPQQGDVLMGFSSDECAETKYSAFGGSYALIVDRVRTNGNMTYVEGEPVSKLGDVFEQFITVEQIGVDANNQIHRRIAGLTPEGKIRKTTSEDTGDIPLLYIAGTFSKEWQPGGNASFSFSADTEIKMTMRAVYNITWTHFMVVLDKTFHFSIKPTIAASLQKSWIGTPGFWEIPGIVFPAVCPIFETNPCPDLFVRTGGALSLKLNLPLVKLGLGEHLVIDDRVWFPISYGLHMIPNDDQKFTDEMIDLSGEVNLSGYVQMGIEFQAKIGTASWFSSIFSTDIGLHLYTGPKVSGQVSISTEILQNQGANLYTTLRNSYLDLSLLSLDLEAGATAKVGWDDPDEVTFYNKSWEFMKDTIRFAPQLGETTVEFDEDNATISMRPARERLVGASSLKLGIREDDKEELTKYGFWPIGMKDNDTVVSHTLNHLKYGVYYHAVPVVSCGVFGEFEVPSSKLDFFVPLVINMSSDSIRFGAFSDLTKTVDCYSNVPAGRLSFNGNMIDYMIDTDSSMILVNDTSAESFQLRIKAKPNKTVFDRFSYHRSLSSYAKPYFQVNLNNRVEMVPFGVYQEADLSNVKASFTVMDSLTINGEKHWPKYYGSVTATANDSNLVHIEGSYSETWGGETTTYTIFMDLKRYANSGRYGDFEVRADGILTNTKTSGTHREYLEVVFDYNTTSGGANGIPGGVSSAKYQVFEDGACAVNDSFGPNDHAYIQIHAEANKPN